MMIHNILLRFQALEFGQDCFMFTKRKMGGYYDDGAMIMMIILHFSCAIIFNWFVSRMCGWMGEVEKYLRSLLKTLSDFLKF